MRYTKPQYWYHLTNQINWGHYKTLKPKSNVVFEDAGEPALPRICVGPSVPHCLASIHPSTLFKVYRTKYKVRAVIPWRVSDVSITKERWLVQPTEFVFVRRLDKDISSFIMDNSSSYRGWDVKNKSLEYFYAKTNQEMELRFFQKVFSYNGNFILSLEEAEKIWEEMVNELNESYWEIPF
jgi:hypothetical protein